VNVVDPGWFLEGFKQSWKLGGPLGIVGAIAGIFAALPGETTSDAVVPGGLPLKGCHSLMWGDTVGPCTDTANTLGVLVGLGVGAMLGGLLAVVAIALVPSLRQSLAPREE
jgi:hypothetical protein